MQATNKKFADKKNIANNQQSLFKSFAQKHEKKPGNVQTNNKKGFNDNQNIYSKAYQAEDTYSEIVKNFKAAKIDLAYQNFDNAFPFYKTQKYDKMFIEVKIDPLKNDFAFQQQKSIYLLQMMNQEDLNNEQQKNEMFQFQTESDSQQIYAQQQSTKQNSHQSS